MPREVPKEKLEAVRKEMHTAFKCFDSNGDGYITVAELEQAMIACGQRPTRLELKLLMKQADKDRNGVISLDEFVEFMIIPQKCKFTKQELLLQFKIFDKDGDGFITRPEMNSIVSELKLEGDFPFEVIESIFTEADTNGDGQISLDEFILAMS